ETPPEALRQSFSNRESADALKIVEPRQNEPPVSDRGSPQIPGTPETVETAPATGKASACDRTAQYPPPRAHTVANSAPRESQAAPTSLPCPAASHPETAQSLPLKKSIRFPESTAVLRVFRLKICGTLLPHPPAKPTAFLAEVWSVQLCLRDFAQ